MSNSNNIKSIVPLLNQSTKKWVKNRAGEYFMIVNPGGEVIAVAPEKLRSEDCSPNDSFNSSVVSTTSNEEVHNNDERLSFIDKRED
ncbi:hypothetical protein KQX54_013742 [Cotesia glomerata]|uniref:Uncharacterized protein n=1 Tax=Cotesia glomerata TaxID=32391 RepID=A0AAV7HTU5_COTGL|nr:hypothetical protein KQX54_013742 [Cotesia glomerata]